MTSLLEPVAAGLLVAIINKYIVNKLDPFGWCYNHCCEKEEEECLSPSSTSINSDTFHVHHF